ncbi:hypothetical protein FPZ24_11605 [Sphingomonas panacisoli]|uniref:Uncharacterized protein n=1 Tax=Sphingomonas panacisoli TaxID=1813879 RepID=A0A5B8LIB0_9SPHN|nr:hypothetical protein [Sphingomonas panacisoli]QDZ08047.1 hypothetical protein FPZ24_11605 [Sphingomonas panacisoli]
MSAQRKLVDPAPTTPVEDAVQADYQSPRTADGELPMSPAVLLQEQLAARIADANVNPVEAQAAAEDRRWPMPLRIATIVGLSLALWGGIVLTAVKIIT